MSRISRRGALRVLGTAAGVAVIGAARGVAWAGGFAAEGGEPVLAAGAPLSAERLALIAGFRKESEGLEKKFEARSYKSDWTMPYRLFQPEAGAGAAAGKLPLVIYLHGSGGLGDDNLKQLEQGNVFGTRVWLLPENQKQFPCYVMAPQTDRGWAKYDMTQESDGRAKVVAGAGEGTQAALEIVDALRREFAIDERRIYVMGQSMGGAGVWNMIASRPGFFAAGVICCGSESTEVGTESPATAIWNFHGDADKTVAVEVSRQRMAARKKAGGKPVVTEYAGVDHNCWEWAFTEPALGKWMFGQKSG
jgi:predicted peptidase